MTWPPSILRGNQLLRRSEPDARRALAPLGADEDREGGDPPLGRQLVQGAKRVLVGAVVAEVGDCRALGLLPDHGAHGITLVPATHPQLDPTVEIMHVEPGGRRERSPRGARSLEDLFGGFVRKPTHVQSHRSGLDLDAFAELRGRERACGLREHRGGRGR
jgi:hypothetical protein